MSVDKTGGPAFPLPSGPHNFEEQGMSLRDYFAGQYSLRVDESMVNRCFHLKKDVYHVLAEECYKFADAMILKGSK
jgi:hypothetical protein